MKVTNRVLITLFISILALSFFYKKEALAFDTFQDNFNDGNADGWQIIRNPCGSDWLVENNKYGIRINRSCVTETIPVGLNIPSSVSYSFEVDMTMAQTVNMDRNFVFKYKDPENWYGIHTIGSSVYLQKVVNGGEYRLPNWHFSYGFVDNETYRFKIEIRLNEYKVYINNTLYNVVTDSVPTFPNFSAGLQASAGGISTSEVWFDNVVIKELGQSTPTPTSTPTPIPPTPTPLSVPYLSQKNPLWADEIYNTAQNWSSNPFISRWGCALTSAAMTLLYHGIDRITPEINLNPKTLNDWLKNQVDGYIGNGFLNWRAVTRLTRLANDSFGSKVLEFRRDGLDFDLLNSDLEQNQPPILEVPNHFVVATGKNDDSYFINDPAWEERKTLEDYNDTFLSLRRFIPSNTDLSALMIVADSNVNLQLLKNNNPVPDAYPYFEQPLIDDIDGQSMNSEALQIIDLPKPEAGIYQLFVYSSGGNQSFNLDIYSYDEEANPTLNSIFGYSNESLPTSFQITISEDGKIEKWQRSPSFERTKADIQSCFENGLITNGGITQSLLAKINQAEKLKNQGKFKLASILLNQFLKELELHKDKFISEDAYTLLKQDAQALLSLF